MKEGKLATHAEGHAFLVERGIQYASADSVGGLFRRRKAKLKTGRPCHQLADTAEQGRFKKVCPHHKRSRRCVRALRELREAAEGPGLR
jgi:hypothetical protein